MDQKPAYRLVPVEELHARMQTGKGPSLIDTLPSDHFSRCHLPGAANACVYEVAFGGRMEALAPDRSAEVVLYGTSEASREAATAAEKLVRAGYRHVGVLLGGLKAWREKGYPLEGSDPRGEDPPASVVLPDGTVAVDTDSSLIEWTGRNPNGKHHGTLRLSGGHLLVKDARVTGTFTIDLRTIRNINLEGDPLQPVLLAHLASDDFFFVEAFPTAEFRIELARLLDGSLLSVPNFSVEGLLTLRGVTLPLQFMATLSRLSDGALAAEAHFDIDRTQWNILYGSSRFYEHLGMHLVFDLISLQVRVVAR